MAYRGPLSSGQPYNGRQQPIPPPGPFHAVYGNPQPPQFPSAPYAAHQQPLQQAHYGSHVTNMNGPPPQLPVFDGAYDYQMSQHSPHLIQYDGQAYPQPAQYLPPIYPQHAPQEPQYAPQIAQPAANPMRHAYHYAEQPPSVSPRPSLPNTPSVTPRSPGVSKKSAGRSPKAKIRDPASVLVCAADECFEKARASVHLVATSTADESLGQYQKLIATGLACLEAVLQSGKLSPRHEAKARLRYASVLCEETDNLMEAETCLTKGIALCDKHRYVDLGYSMHYLLLKVLFQRNQKAAMLAADKQIASARARRHPAWVYTFCFLKASFYLQHGTGSDAGALGNLRTIASEAEQNGDSAVSAFASALEGLALIKATTRSEDNLDLVQGCIAQASKHQLEVDTPQIGILLRLLDLACSMQQKHPWLVLVKLSALQEQIGLSEGWVGADSTVLLPVKKQSGPSQPVSEDTAAVIQLGAPEDAHNYLVMSFAAKEELRILVLTFLGLASLPEKTKDQTDRMRQNNMPVKPSHEFWGEAVGYVKQWMESSVGATGGSSLRESVSRAGWVSDVHCYLNILIGLDAATNSQWTRVAESMRNLESLTTSSTSRAMTTLSRYLCGSYYQGTGDLDKALSVFREELFDLSDATLESRSTRVDVALLAAMNVLWIMQHPKYRNDAEAMRVLETIRPLCEEHKDEEIRMVFSLVLATIGLVPPASMGFIKDCIKRALNLARPKGNKHCLAIALSYMRYKLFDKLVCQQATQSAKAASAQAKRSGNKLWMSVADGMLAETLDLQEQHGMAEASRKSATTYASMALGGDVLGA